MGEDASRTHELQKRTKIRIRHDPLYHFMKGTAPPQPRKATHPRPGSGDSSPGSPRQGGLPPLRTSQTVRIAGLEVLGPGGRCRLLDFEEACSGTRSARYRYETQPSSIS